LERDRPLRDDGRSWRRRQQPSSSPLSGRRRGAPGVCLLALVLGVLDCFCPTHTLRAWLHLLPDRGEASPFLGSAASKLEMSGRRKSFFF